MDSNSSPYVLAAPCLAISAALFFLGSGADAPVALHLAGSDSGTVARSASLSAVRFFHRCCCVCTRRTE